ncbi:MAG: GNAT family protein [Candidatus Thorarchaeota archaeon]|nr:GNAT family protein [Candidatus Thorarchaeota archaeon]
MYYGQFVKVRAIEMDDLDILMKYLNDLDTKRFLGSALPRSRKAEEQWLEGSSTADPWKDGRIQLAVEDKKTGKFLGTVSLFDISKQNRHAELGIALWNPEGRDKGYGTDTMNVLLWIGFHILGLNNIYLYALSSNTRAIHVYEKVGFKHIGVFREMLYSMGKFQDVVAMDIVQKEFLEQFPPGTLPGNP